EEQTKMIDHVSIGVRDVATTKRFYDAALKPLGYQCLSEGKDSLGYGHGTVAFWISRRRIRCRPICNPACTSASPLRRQRAWTHSTPPRSPPEDGTTACPACAPTTVQAITRPSSSIPTATGSRPIAINPPREPRPGLKFCRGARGDKITAPRENAAHGKQGRAARPRQGGLHANTTRYVARRYRDGSCHARWIGVGEGLATGDGGEFRCAFRRLRLPYPHFRRPGEIRVLCRTRLYAGTGVARGDGGAAQEPSPRARGDRDPERVRHRQFGDALRHEGARRHCSRRRGRR